MKSLRGTKSLDIIFAGTQNRKSLGFAEASLVFDNSDGALPIEYTEVTVTRKIYRSGETGYYINKVPCRLKDVLELFMDTGIGKDGYSIIGQGKIDEILSNKSEDRRNIFEEAAGIVKYRTRKQESEKKLERTKLNLLRINDILTEIETNIEPLKNQAEKAKRYLDLREELKSIEIGLFIYNIEKYKATLEEIIKDEEIYTSQCNDEEGRLERIKQLKEELQNDIDDITVKIEEMSNIGFESQKEIEMLNSDINVADTRILNNNENKIRFEKEIEEAQNRLEELKKEIEQKQEKQQNLKQNKEKFEKELKEKEEELYYVDDGVDEAIIKFEDIPDFIVDYNRNFDMRNLKFYRFGKDVYEPDITTMGEYLDRINPDLRERMIDRLIALQTNEAEIKEYKIADEDVFANVENKMEQEEIKKQKKNKNREAR